MVETIKDPLDDFIKHIDKRMEISSLLLSWMMDSRNLDLLNTAHVTGYGH